MKTGTLTVKKQRKYKSLDFVNVYFENGDVETKVNIHISDDGSIGVTIWKEKSAKCCLSVLNWDKNIDGKNDNKVVLSVDNLTGGV